MEYVCFTSVHEFITSFVAMDLKKNTSCRHFSLQSYKELLFTIYELTEKKYIEYAHK